MSIPIKGTILLEFLWGCGEPIEYHIAQLIKGGAGAEEAKMELNLAKRTAISSEYGQWVPTYGDAWAPNRFGFLVFE
jgi:hypothetical protein